MASFEATYRFILNGVEAYPLIGDEFSYKWEKEDDSYYFRKKLANEVRLRGNDYYTVIDSSVDFEHTFIIQKKDGSTWVDDFTGTFYKTDCEIDEDDGTVDVNPSPADGWDDIKTVLNNEYNLVDLSPEAGSVTFKVRPVLQLVTGLRDTITNICGTAVWEEKLDRVYSDIELSDTYNFVLVTVTSPKYTASFYYRYLTTLTTFAGQSTIARGENDLSTVAPNHEYISKQIVSGGGKLIEDLQDDPTPYPVRCVSDPLLENKYHVIYDSPLANTVEIPINPSIWFCDVATWQEYTTFINDYELTNSEEVTIKDVYALHNSVQLLLSQETDILFENTSVYSEFLYDTNNPVSGDQFNLFITPKSNIRNFFYTDPARKSKIRLSEIFNMLDAVYNVGWHVERSGSSTILRIEHVSWYENGGTYGEQNVSFDLTQSFDQRNLKPQSLYQNKYKYAKSKMPQRLEFSWGDEVSNVFDGLPINMLTKQINKGQIERKEASKFTSDIDHIIISPDINLDGFALLSVDDSGTIINKDVELESGDTFSIQNGGLSYRYLHPLYHRYGLPTANIEINGEANTALSIIRTKQQEVEFISEEEINPLNLIRTEIGSGQVEDMELNIISNKYKATINHDTE